MIKLLATDENSQLNTNARLIVVSCEESCAISREQLELKPLSWILYGYCVDFFLSEIAGSHLRNDVVDDMRVAMPTKLNLEIKFHRLVDPFEPC